MIMEPGQVIPLCCIFLSSGRCILSLEQPEKEEDGVEHRRFRCRIRNRAWIPAHPNFATADNVCSAADIRINAIHITICLWIERTIEEWNQSKESIRLFWQWFCYCNQNDNLQSFSTFETKWWRPNHLVIVQWKRRFVTTKNFSSHLLGWQLLNRGIPNGPRKLYTASHQTPMRQ